MHTGEEVGGKRMHTGGSQGREGHRYSQDRVCHSSVCAFTLQIIIVLTSMVTR